MHTVFVVRGGASCFLTVREAFNFLLQLVHLSHLELTMCATTALCADVSCYECGVRFIACSTRWRVA